MDQSNDESGVKEESLKPSEDIELSIQEKTEEILKVDQSSSSSNSNSHSHIETSDSRSSNIAEDIKNNKNTDCSIKSDLTETSSLRNSASPKNEDQVESSMAQKESPLKDSSSPEANDASRSSEEEVNICDICGDLGREKLLAVCSLCGVGAEHIYCMRIKLDEIPHDWICEDCVNAAKDGKEKIDVNRKEDSMNTTRDELKCQKGDSIVNEERILKGSTMNQEVKTDSQRCENKSKTQSDEQRKCSKKRKAVNPPDLSDSKSVRMKSVLTKVNLPELRKRAVGHSAIGVNTNARFSSSISERILRYKSSGNNGISLSGDDDPTMSYNPFNGTNRRGGGTPQYHVFPLPYCIWQGRFKLQRNGVFPRFCEGIQAHLSRSASQNTVSLAPEFTREILLEETIRSTVWTSVFTANQAAAKNIHIYFFAKDPERQESGYKSLLQHMIMNDVCLKGRVGGFELLIFSSNKLEDGFQSWNGHSFLWGVFRDPKPPLLSGSRAYGYQECNPNFNHAQIPQVPIESRLVNFFQMAKRTFEERPSLPCNLGIANNGRHFNSTAPNLDLSLGLGGASASVSCINIIDKEPSASSRNFHDKEPSLSLSLSTPQPLLGGEAMRMDQMTRTPMKTTEEAESERRRVDTTLSLLRNFG